MHASWWRTSNLAHWNSPHGPWCPCWQIYIELHPQAASCCWYLVASASIHSTQEVRMRNWFHPPPAPPAFGEKTVVPESQASYVLISPVHINQHYLTNMNVGCSQSSYLPGWVLSWASVSLGHCRKKVNSNFLSWMSAHLDPHDQPVYRSMAAAQWTTDFYAQRQDRKKLLFTMHAR